MSGKRGLPPTPTAVLAARGSWRAKIRKKEPVAPSGTPTRPGWVSGEARKVWPKVVAALRDLGTLARTDGAALGRYCCLLVRWVKANAVLMEQGDVYEMLTKDRGVVFKARPEVEIVASLSTLLLRLEQEFGLTPSARARLAIEIVPVAAEQPFKSKIVG